jgi:hypothetical protein
MVSREFGAAFPLKFAAGLSMARSPTRHDSMPPADGQWFSVQTLFPFNLRSGIGRLRFVL